MCPFCGGIDVVQKRMIFSKLDENKYTLAHCTSCELDFFDPLHFENVYENEKIEAYREFHDGTRVFSEWTNAMVKVLKYIKYDFKDKTILEIGPGDGINFLALKKNFEMKSENYYAVELDNLSIEICKKRGVLNVISAFFDKKISSLIGKKFDVILITEVLEHQTNPREFFETVNFLTKEGGIIIITVPNRDRMFIEKREEYGDVPPHHFLRFNKGFFVKNFKEKIVYIDDYEFINKDYIISSKQVGVSVCGNEHLWPFFIPIVLILRMIDKIRGEGLIVIIKK